MVFPELLVKKSGQNIKKPRRSTSKRFEICSKSRSEISSIYCYFSSFESLISTPRDVTGSPTNQHPPCYSTKSHAQRPITNLLLLTALLFMIALGLDVHIDDAHDEDCDNSALTPTPPAQGILQRLLSAFTPARPLEAPASNPPAPHQSPLSETCPPQYAPSTFPRQDESLFSGSGTADDQSSLRLSLKRKLGARRRSISLSAASSIPHSQLMPSRGVIIDNLATPVSTRTRTRSLSTSTKCVRISSPGKYSCLNNDEIDIVIVETVNPTFAQMSKIVNDNLLQLRHPGINNVVTRTFPQDSTAVLNLIKATDQENPLILHASGPPLLINLLPRRTNPNLSVVSLELHNSLLLLYPEVLRHYRVTLPPASLTKDQDPTCLISIGLMTPEPATTEMIINKLPEFLTTEPGRYETDQQLPEPSPAAHTPTEEDSSRTLSDVDQLELVKTLLNCPLQQPRPTLKISSFNEAILNLGRSHLISCLTAEDIEHAKKETVPSLRSKLARHFAKSPLVLTNITLDFITEGMVLTTARRELTYMGVTDEMTDAKDVKTRLCNILKGMPDPSLNADHPKTSLDKPEPAQEHKERHHKPDMPPAITIEEPTGDTNEATPKPALEPSLPAEAAQPISTDSAAIKTEEPTGDTSEATPKPALAPSFPAEAIQPTSTDPAASQSASPETTEQTQGETLEPGATPKSLPVPMTTVWIKQHPHSLASKKDQSELVDKLLAEPVAAHHTRAHSLSQAALAELVPSASETNLKKCVKAESLGTFKKGDKANMKKALIKSTKEKYPTDTTLKALINSLKKGGLENQLNALGFHPRGMNVDNMKNKLYSLLTETNEKQPSPPSPGTRGVQQDQKVASSSTDTKKEEGSSVTNKDEPKPATSDKPAEKKKKGPKEKKITGDEKAKNDGKVNDINREDADPLQVQKPDAANEPTEPKTQTTGQGPASKDQCPLSQNSILEEAILDIQREIVCHEATLSLLIGENTVRKTAKDKAIKSPGKDNNHIQALERRLVASETLCLSLAEELRATKSILQAAESRQTAQLQNITADIIKLQCEAKLRAGTTLPTITTRKAHDSKEKPMTIIRGSQTAYSHTNQGQACEISSAKKPITTIRGAQTDPKVTMTDKRLQTDPEITQTPPSAGCVCKIGSAKKPMTTIRGAQTDPKVTMTDRRLQTDSKITQTPPSAVSQPPNMTQPSDQPSHTIPPGNQMESPQSHTPAQPQHTSVDTQLPSAAQRPTSAECQSIQAPYYLGSQSKGLMPVPDTRGKSSPLDSQQHRPINGDRKCLVIHDDHHNSLFPINRHGLQIVSHNAGSLKSLSPNKLDDLINKHRPESLFLHLGINDIQRLNRHPDAIVDDLEDIMNHILHETTIQLCVSTILRTNNPDLNKKIEYVNRWIFQISNKLRRESRGASERIFTRDNSAIDKAILLQKDGISLNDYGTIKLSIRLISGLNKTLTNSRYRNG